MTSQSAEADPIEERTPRGRDRSKRATRVLKVARLLDDPARFQQVIDGRRLGDLLGVLRGLLRHFEDEVTLPHPEGELPGAEDPQALAEDIAWRALAEVLARNERVDHREHWAMMEHLRDAGFEVVSLATGSGDYASERVSIERKEDDLFESMKDGHLLRQLSEMRAQAEFSFLLITKDYEQVREMMEARQCEESVLIGFIASCCAIGYPPLFIPEQTSAGMLVRAITRKVQDDHLRLFVPHPTSPSSGDVRAAMLEAVPGVSTARRKALLREYPNFDALCAAEVEDLAGVKVNRKRLGESLARRIHAALHG